MNLPSYLSPETTVTGAQTAGVAGRAGTEEVLNINCKMLIEDSMSLNRFVIEPGPNYLLVHQFQLPAILQLNR